MIDNFSSDAPHERREELDHPEALVLYALGAVILLMVGTGLLVWWL